MKMVTKGFELCAQPEMSRSCKRLSVFVAFFFLLCLAILAQAQEVSASASASRIETAMQQTSALPDVPSPAAQASGQVQPPAFALDAQQKLSYASENAFGVSSIVFAAAGAGVNQMQNLYPEFHQGSEGYGRYFWHSYADQAVDSYFVNFILAEALHTDPRYHPLRSGRVWTRLKHAGAGVVLAHNN